LLIGFKREVYQLALSELARYLAKGVRMQQLAWGTPLDIFQSFYSKGENSSKESTKTDEQK
jgi:putative (di)nucleoside polyphosphate hydrolase